MCQKGVNTEQMRLMISQAGDAISMAQQWLERIHHMADHADLTESSKHVAQASVMLGEARARLETASNDLENRDENPNASVELV